MLVLIFIYLFFIYLFFIYLYMHTDTKNLVTLIN